MLQLNTVVNEISKLLRRLIGEDITLQIHLSPGIGPIKIDPGQLEQVIINLAVNARDAMPTGGRLTISTAEVTLAEGYAPDGLPPGGYIELIITDTGIGITDAVKARIFEPFFTTKSPGKGTGLGLATVYGIIHQAGGRIMVESRPGAGASFTILLPAAQNVEESLELSGSGVHTHGTETILVVEDEAEVRRLARRTLEHQGYTIIEAGSGHEALALTEAFPGAINLLITDVVMPGMSGRALAEAIRTQRPTIPVLYVSGYTDEAVIGHGVAITSETFLQKPFTPEILARKVRMTLDQQ